MSTFSFFCHFYKGINFSDLPLTSIEEVALLKVATLNPIALRKAKIAYNFVLSAILHRLLLPPIQEGDKIYATLPPLQASVITLRYIKVAAACGSFGRTLLFWWSLLSLYIG